MVVMLAIGGAAMAGQASYPGEANWKAVCAREMAKPLVVPKFVNEAELRHCDSERSYYGFDGARDFRGALQCGYYQRAHPQTDIANAVYGPGVLSMLYANGLGVARNYDLAIRFACENTWAADAEMEGRLGHLEHMRDSHSTATDFDLCDDATSGLMEGACAEIGEREAKAKREQKLKTISAGWSPATKQAFVGLQKAEQAFADARGRNETDLSGTGRAAFSIEASAKVHDQFLANLERLAKGLVPEASEVDYKAADAKLNADYRQMMAERSKDKPGNPGEVLVSGIRETERIWIKFRDAWVEFAKVAYPKVSTAQVGTWITKQRIGQLKDIE